MIESINEADLNEANLLLKEFNYQLDNKNLKGDFLKAVVYKKDKILGVLVYDLIYDRIEIEYIIVDKKYRRLGIASQLLKCIESENKDIENITLEVKESNKSAIEFYKKHRFKTVALRKNYYGNENAILMIKEKNE